MTPKVEAARQFTINTSRPAMIGALSQAFAVLVGEAGTEVLPRPMRKAGSWRPRQV